jgi:O-methyltransferase involved in polyketide biosynthesis
VSGVTREKVQLTGPPETMLATLYLRALDNRSRQPILGDRWADEAVRRIDYDFTRFRLDQTRAGSVAIRAKALDDWVRSELRPEMRVLHLGCGLDSRFQRIGPPETVAWYDVDLPEVIELRRRLYGREPQHTIGLSVTDPELFTRIPGDRQILIVAEGLTMYLTEADGVALLRRIVEHFPSGRLLFDAFSSLGVRMSNRWNPPVVVSGSHLEWGIDDPRVLESKVPGLRLVTEWSFTEAPELQRFPPLQRTLLRVSGRIPGIRRMGRLLHYRFGGRRSEKGGHR